MRQGLLTNTPETLQSYSARMGRRAAQALPSEEAVVLATQNFDAALSTS